MPTRRNCDLLPRRPFLSKDDLLADRAMTELPSSSTSLDVAVLLWQRRMPVVRRRRCISRWEEERRAEDVLQGEDEDLQQLRPDDILEHSCSARGPTSGRRYWTVEDCSYSQDLSAKRTFSLPGPSPPQK